jgi:N6-L-threonylcarbamoyladenine synthase
VIRILGIDTSCDDTGVGLVSGGRVLANVVASQAALHARYGGVMPEQASREHLSVIDGVVAAALADAGCELTDLAAVAATRGPGLVGALLVGLSYGRALAWGLGLPFVPIHHLEGHIASSATGGELTPPFLCLISSGGHTALFDVPAWGDYRQLGRRRDDAAGEAFDKVARLLDLGYPGGAPLAALATAGDPDAYPFTVPLLRQQGFDFSFSGLKTAVAVLVEQRPDAAPADVAASFQRTAVAHLIRVVERGLKRTRRERLVVAGGVAANAELRRRLELLDVELYVPPLDLATDNGAMIALAAERRLAVGAAAVDDPWAVDAAPYLPLATSASS